MNLKEINGILDTEAKMFGGDVQNAIGQAAIRRREIETKIAEAVNSNSDETLSEDDFFGMIDIIKRMGAPLWDILAQAGFDGRAATGWGNKQLAPREESRRHVLQMLLLEARGYYTNGAIQSDVDRVMEEWGPDPLTPMTEAKADKAHLSALATDFFSIERFVNAGISHSLAVRVSNVIRTASHDESYTTVQEFLKYLEDEAPHYLKLLNFGKRSLEAVLKVTASAQIPLPKLGGSTP